MDNAEYLTYSGQFRDTLPANIIELYDVARKSTISARLVVFHDDIFEDLQSLMSSLINEGFVETTIYETVSKLNPEITEEDVTMMYYRITGKGDEPDGYRLWQIINNQKYDDQMTLLYKWRYYAQLRDEI